MEYQYVVKASLFLTWHFFSHKELFQNDVTIENSNNGLNEIIDTEPIMQINQGEENEKEKENEKQEYPSWWQSDIQFPPSLYEDKWFLLLNDKINDLVTKYKYREIKDSSKIFLTDCCFTMKPLNWIQIIALFMKLQGSEYKEIKKELGIDVSEKSLYTCIRRTLLGDLYDNNTIIRTRKDMSYIDSLLFLTELDLSIASSKPFTLEQAKARANELVKIRKEKALYLWNSISHKGEKSTIMNKYFEDDTELTSAQITYLIHQAGFVLKSGEMIKRDRGINCTAAVLIRWSLQFGSSIYSYKNDPELLWNFDESMIDLTSKNKKYILRRNSPRALKFISETKPHISAGFCFNAIGTRLAPFVILSNIKTLDKELTKLTSGDQIYFASQSKGWMDYYLFENWCRYFCNKMLEFRKTLIKEKRNKKIILFIDSHNSRYNPQAMKLLQKCGIRVITFPPHCTHVLQPYDVGIAKKFKCLFAKEYEAMIQSYQNPKNDDAIPIDQYRIVACRALLTAWEQSVNFTTAQIAFAACGLWPFNSGVMLAARGVNLLSTIDPEKELRKSSDALHITSTELTNQTFIKRMSFSKQKKDDQTIIKKKDKKQSYTFFQFRLSDSMLIDKTNEILNEVTHEKNENKRIKSYQNERINLDLDS